MDIINEIVEKIPLTEKWGSKKHITYFYIDDALYQYEMAYDNEWDAYGTSSHRVEFEGTVEEIRMQTIKFITSLDLAFELGEKYHSNKSYNRNLHLRVKHYLIEEIVKNLSAIYKDVKIMEIPGVIPVSIGEYQYVFSLERNSSKYYKKFELIGELAIDPIEM